MPLSDIMVMLGSSHLAACTISYRQDYMTHQHALMHGRLQQRWQTGWRRRMRR